MPNDEVPNDEDRSLKWNETRLHCREGTVASETDIRFSSLHGPNLTCPCAVGRCSKRAIPLDLQTARLYGAPLIF